MYVVQPSLLPIPQCNTIRCSRRGGECREEGNRAMASYTPTTRHGQNESGHQHNIYIRRGSDDVEFDVPIPSFRGAEHALMDTFRKNLNLRTCRESRNASICDNEMLDEDLGHPPATHDTPSGAHMNSLQSDSPLSTAFRSRSRSDATSAPLSCRQNLGTIVLFPNRSEKQSKRHNLRIRSERHSVCVTDLAELKSTSLSVASKHPFVDSKLASVAVKNVNNMCNRPLSAIEIRSSMWNLPCQSSPLQLVVDRNDTFEKYCSPLTNASIMQTVPHVESKLASPFSNYAILIKEVNCIII
ncbi:unnamed protein product [Onchocerca ochengi]|uniref:Uncharacterized protein n=1 Tax=Onchocerca ochengi TaxID=42157 RepID=A0A182E4C3_ONCOC|nr:unnamed protein product [Onchocerca ochengi]